MYMKFRRKKPPSTFTCSTDEQSGHGGDLQEGRFEDSGASINFKSGVREREKVKAKENVKESRSQDSCGLRMTPSSTSKVRVEAIGTTLREKVSDERRTHETRPEPS